MGTNRKVYIFKTQVLDVIFSIKMNKNKKNKTFYISLLVTFFILGWFLDSVSETLNIHQEKPFFGSEERFSPYDRIQENHLQLFSDKLIINFPEIQLAHYTNTDSMDPLIDEYAIGLEIMPKSEGDVHVGDVVAHHLGNDLIVHRVISIGKDNLGWYAMLKGDNSEEYDPEKVRFEQIKYVLIGVLY